MILLFIVLQIIFKKTYYIRHEIVFKIVNSFPPPLPQLKYIKSGTYHFCEEHKENEPSRDVCKCDTSTIYIILYFIIIRTLDVLRALRALYAYSAHALVASVATPKIVHPLH